MEALGRGTRRALALAVVVGTGVGTAVAQEPTPQPDVSVTPTSMSFGTVAPGSQSAPSTLTWTNRGGSDVRHDAIVVSSGFAVTEDTCAGVALAPGATCTTAVVFRPDASRTYRGTLNRLAADGTNQRQLRVSLSGRTPPTQSPRQPSPRAELFATPRKLSFGNVRHRRSSKPLHVTFTNIGTRPTGDLAPVIAGAHKHDFRISSTTCSGVKLQPRASCVVAVVASPKGRREHRATLRPFAASGVEVTVAVYGLRSKPAKKRPPAPPAQRPVDATPAR